MYVGKTGEENRAGRDRGYRNHRVEGANMQRLQLHIKPKTGDENCRNIRLAGASLEMCIGDCRNIRLAGASLEMCIGDCRNIRLAGASLEMCIGDSRNKYKFLPLKCRPVPVPVPVLTAC